MLSHKPRIILLLFLFCLLPIKIPTLLPPYPPVPLQQQFMDFAIAADPPGLITYPENKIMGFRGLDTRATAPTLTDGRATSLKNVKLSSSFNLRQRYGYDTVNDTTLDDYSFDPPAVTGIFNAKYSDGSNIIYAFVGDKLKYDNGKLWTDVPGTPTITEDQDYQWQCVLALDKAICTDDYDVPIKVSATPSMDTLYTGDLTDSLDKVKVLAWFRNYLIFGNTVENSIERPTRIRWSDVGTIETYDDDNYNDIATYGGDEIIGFAELYGDLYIFLKNSIWRMSLVGGDDLFTFTKVIDGIGAIARDSLHIVYLSDNRSVVMFLDSISRVLLFDGVGFMDVGNIIQSVLNNLSDPRLQYSVGTFDGTSYFLSVTDGSDTEHSILLEYNLEMQEWSKHTDINANALAQVEEATATVKTYFGNYDAFVYWLNNPDLKNDVDGATGIVDSAGRINSATQTGVQIILDATLTSGVYTGAIIKITSGTAVGEERVILTSTDTGVTVTSDFTVTPDSTSVYTIGAIDAEYKTKWFDLGNSAQEKSFLGMLVWGEEASAYGADVHHSIDFGSRSGSTSIDLSPSSSSLWDSAIWDTATWAITGDKFTTVKLSGLGNFLQVEFANPDIDESFNLYGFNILAIGGDIKQ